MHPLELLAVAAIATPSGGAAHALRHIRWVRWVASFHTHTHTYVAARVVGGWVCCVVWIAAAIATPSGGAAHALRHIRWVRWMDRHRGAGAAAHQVGDLRSSTHAHYVAVRVCLAAVCVVFQGCNRVMCVCGRGQLSVWMCACISTHVYV
jgi:hypothetical protein